MSKLIKFCLYTFASYLLQVVRSASASRAEGRWADPTPSAEPAAPEVALEMWWPAAWTIVSVGAGGVLRRLELVHNLKLGLGRLLEGHVCLLGCKVRLWKLVSRRPPTSFLVITKPNPGKKVLKTRMLVDAVERTLKIRK